MFAFSLVLALASAAPSAPTPLPTLSPAMVKMTMPSFSAADTSISVPANQPFQIRLNVTSGTGYSWRPQGQLPAGLTLIGTSQAPREKSLPGAPAQQILVFRAASPAKVHVTLEYVRPWEHGVKPAKLQNYSIMVHK